jgi:hypothetical protein
MSSESDSEIAAKIFSTSNAVLAPGPSGRNCSHIQTLMLLSSSELARPDIRG